MRLLRLMVVVVLLSGLGSQAWAAESRLDSLKGVKNLSVLVEHLNDKAKEAGLTNEDLQTTAELRLRAAGITVISDAEALASKEWIPYIYVDVNLMKIPDREQYAYSIVVECMQAARVISNKAFTIAVTWDTKGMGVSGSSRTKQTIKEKVADLCDKFANDFLSVNPKTPAPAKK